MDSQCHTRPTDLRHRTLPINSRFNTPLVDSSFHTPLVDSRLTGTHFGFRFRMGWLGDLDGMRGTFNWYVMGMG